MSETELLEENKQLKERIDFLEDLLNKGNRGHTTAYNAVRAIIIEKVKKEVDISGISEQWKIDDTYKKAERRIMKDLQWDLRIRTTADFKSEHVKSAKEYIDQYILSEDLKKSRWTKEWIL